MGKRAIGIVLGGLVFFLWGAASWMVMPWHRTTVKALPQEQLIRDVLKTVINEPGFYLFPWGAGEDGRPDAAALAQKMKSGPAGVLAYVPRGGEPMGAKRFIVGFLSGCGVAFLGMVVLVCAQHRVTAVVPRAGLVATLGLASWLSAHLMYWNWFYFPLNVTLVALGDSIVGFLLLGFTLARFVEV